MKEEALKIIKKLADNGYQAYIIGGFVRDLILKIDTYDIDICTNATPKEIQKLFDEAIISPFEYGSIHFKINNIDFEITTFRKEIKYENNRKPVEIKYIDDLKEDLLRRDFTVNTLCMDKDGNIIDMLHANNDLNNQLIKTVGNANLKIEEDSLRILRAIRFATVLDFKIDNELKQAIINNKDLLKILSFYRKKDELNRIFMSVNKEKGINLIKELDLEKSLDIVNVEKALLTNDLIGIWAVIDKNNYYPYTKEEKGIIEDIRSMINEDIKNKYIMYKYGNYILSIVCELKKLNKIEYLKKYNKLQIKSISEINISANEICDILNKEPGPFLKDIIKDIEYKIVNDKLKNDKEKLKKYIEKTYRG